MSKTPADGWEIRTVGSLGSVRGGKRLPKGRLLTSVPTPHPYIRVTDMRHGGVDTSNIRFVPEDVAQSVRAYRIFRTDIFISVAGTLGIIGRIPESLNGANLTENADRITSITCDVDYLMYSLLSEPIQNEIESIRTVGAQPKLALGRIKQFEIPIPVSRAEQARIAQAIRDADNLIATLERLIAKKRAIKQGMMQQLLTGRTRLPGFTTGWQSLPFEELATPATERVNPQRVSPHIRLIELEHIESGTGQVIDETTAANAISLKTVFRPGDILFGKLRAYLRKFALAESGGLCSTEIWALRARGSNRGAFVRYIVETDQFIEAASGAYGTHMPRADWNVVRRLKVSTPPPDEQDAIANVLGDADREICALRHRLSKAQAIKVGMMQQLLTGRTRLPAESDG